MAQPKIFVSHSHADDSFTEMLVADLCRSGADAWMDKTDLGAGNFQQRISDALANCEWFVLVLSRDALASPWVVQEVDAANRLKNQGQIRDLIFIKAGPFEHRELPALWGVFNIFDATSDYAAARDRTLRAVGLSPATSAATSPVTPPTVPPRLPDLGFAVRGSQGKAFILPPLVTIPAGPFLMGSDPKRDKGAFENEQPQHTVTLPAYEIGRFPVTVMEYVLFMRPSHAEPKDWKIQFGKVMHPVVNVTWRDAVAYAAWLSERTGEFWRLPSEAEWEKAARGTDGRIFPWGDSFDKVRCNTSESGIKATTPVGRYSSGASPYGVQDMAGNVWEWTGSLYVPYPHTLSGKREDPNSPHNRVLRGGSWKDAAWSARAAYRSEGVPVGVNDAGGFRVVRAVSSP
jgi:formylglycine-generating enzyme required for sulfatase activity